MSGRISGLTAGANVAPKAASTTEAGPATSTTTSTAAEEAKAGKSEKRSHELGDAARQFEAIFVRSMLAQTGIAGAGRSGTYGDFAVDALAQSVTAGKGLGLAEMIKRAVEKSHEALKKDG